MPIYGALIWFSQVFVFFLSQNRVLCFEKAKSYNLTKKNLIEGKDISTTFLAFGEHKLTISWELAFFFFFF